MLKNILRQQLISIIQRIDDGSCDITEDDLDKIVKSLDDITRKDDRISKYQACRYLNIGRSTFDLYVKQGKIPQGIKQQGFKELSWRKRDLEKIKPLL